MKVLLIGYRGQLGMDLQRTFASEDVMLAGHDTLPVEDAARVDAFLNENRPQLILNCAAFHRVDDCEDQAEAAFAVNVFGVRNLALAARKIGAVLVHFSTDYVFDGPQRNPYIETDAPCPKCIYGVSKAAGELMLQSICPTHFLFRVSGLYGYAGSREKGTNFVETMISLARQGKPIRVVNDQVLTPTSTMDVAAAVRQIVTTGQYGLYHLTNAGQCSWYEFTEAIFHNAGLTPDLTPVSSEAFPTRAKRPNYSVLDNRRLRNAGFSDLPDWRDALKRYVAGRAAAGRN
ncbi:MAG: dTDP-4-dehydrorhamnose reductase [Terriglobia bacterium]|nr:MAG: dTDP-4-dehydrorhamnose reductase [Terriglobia bacterium]